MNHSAFCTSSKAHAAAFCITQESRVMQFASYTYDVSMGEIFTTLMHGGCVCVPSEEDRLNNLARTINNMNVNWLFLTPTVAGILRPPSVPRLKVLVLSGEHATTDNVKTWANQVTLINSYGPAECAIWSSCTAGLEVGADPANLGRHVGSITWVAEVNNSNKLSPIGCVGELLIEGPILARGYLNDQEKTAAAFIEDPPWAEHFGPGRRRRFYKTGDLVRYNPDGTLNFIGRKDTQVKLHGQRLELGEVEHHLKSLAPSDWQVTVEMIQPASRDGDPILAGFICAGDRPYNTADTDLALATIGTIHKKLLELEAALAAQLPSYMVPAAYIPLQHLPLTSSGKTDRQKLRQLGSRLTAEQLVACSVAERTKRAPSTEMELKLQRLWTEVLHLESSSIGADDSFFRLGGDSIRAMRLVAAAREEGIVLTVAGIFETPTISGMSKSSRLVDDERLIDIAPFSLLADHATVESIRAQAASMCGVETHTIEDIYPCIPLQEGLMALSTKQAGAYVAQSTFRLPVDLDTSRFQEAWELTVKDLPILRTRIVETKEHGLLQVVLDAATVWSMADDLETYLKEDSQTQMGLGQCLSRHAIVRRAEDGLLFVWAAHHAVYDGWTMRLVLERVELYYQGASLVPLVPYNQFIRHVGALDHDASAHFWRSQLTGASYTQFPMLPSPQHQASADARLVHSAKLVWKPESSITSSTVVRAAWAVVVAEYSGSTDVVFGVTLSGRNASVPGVDKMIGPTISTVPVRVCVDSSESVAKYLESVQTQAIDMIEFEQTGLQEIRRLGSGMRDTCDFQNILVIQAALEMDGEMAIFNSPISGGPGPGFSVHPLTVECVLNDQGVEIVAHFDSHIIDHEQMERILFNFEHVLKQLLSESNEVRVGNVGTISPKDHSNILGWNHKCPEAINACVHELVAQQVLARPDASAICGWDASFSYRELDELSTRLAHYLVGLGVGPETFVPLCFEKSAWTIVAMLAVLKAGGAFVPLDPSHPVERRKAIIDDVKARVMLVSPRQQASYADAIETVVKVSAADVEQLPFTTIHVQSVVSSHCLAYVLFTSGSTGRPKGVMVEQGSFSTSLIKHGKTLNLKSSSRVLQFASYIFDANLAEIFTTLIYGGCVCIPSDNDRLENITLAMRKMNVNWAMFTPSFIRLIKPEAVPGLRTLVLVGEAMRKENIEIWAGRLQLLNGYGPTEACIISLAREVTLEDCCAEKLGQGVGSVSWVVDATSHERLVPIGCVGELLIEGPILARGYLNDQKKTVAAFIENPVWAEHFEPGRRRRFYKTGDLVRYNSDGTLNFIGRKDTQVKLHGQRLELGEVEHHLKSLAPSDWQVIVEMIQPVSCEGDPILAGFVCVRDKPYDMADTDLALSTMGTIHEKLVELEIALAAQLPSYMVPAAYIPLQHLPLTSSGKTDRQKLRQLGSRLTAEQLVACSVGERTKRAPSTKREVTLQQLWADVLHLEPSSIGADDSFFRLGGDSIKAMRLVAAARGNKMFLNVADVLLKPRLWELALLTGDNEQCNNNLKAQQASLSAFTSIDNQLKQSLNNAACAQAFVSNAEVEEIFEATSHQIFAITTGLLKSRDSTNYFTFKFDSTVDKSDLERACRRLVEHHQILRTVFIVHHRRVFQVVLRSPRVEFDQYKRCSRGEEVISELIDKDRAQDVKLGQLMVRFMYVDYGTEGSCLIFRMSHAQYDGVCLPTICKDLKAAYMGEELSKGLSFVHFVSGVRRAQTAEAEAFWTGRLEGSSMTQFLSRSEPPLGNVLTENHVARCTVPKY